MPNTGDYVLRAEGKVAVGIRYPAAGFLHDTWWRRPRYRRTFFGSLVAEAPFKEAK